MSEEKDPDGLKPSDAGAKLDAGKQMPMLVLGGFATALEKVTEIGTFGANKYSPDGWKSVKNGRFRYFQAFGRHILASFREELDPDSGLPHLAHAAWNLLAVLEFDYGTLNQD